ncbi:hypothetical protein [Streptomyces sp. NPDC050738]|uniref:hypothetical protein n=1 Tax=Streptomyces sp. NPDC050738 TaxID=3154744 RepID=UPI00344276A6
MSTRPRHRKLLLWSLAACVAWTLAVAVWAGVALLTPDGAGAEDSVLRKAGMHIDQHHPEGGRYYDPTYARTEADGTAVLRYEVGSGPDSSVDDFLRTYEITAAPRHTGASEDTYTDTFGDVRRTFTVTYDPSADPSGYDYARITVRALPEHSS